MIRGPTFPSLRAAVPPPSIIVPDHRSERVKMVGRQLVMLAVTLLLAIPADGFVSHPLRGFAGSSKAATVPMRSGRGVHLLKMMSSNDGGEEKKVRVPDAITMTDNSAKRLTNAQMRAKQAGADEPEALRQMRLKREAEEAAQSEEGRKDAEKRAKEGKFVSGQDVREARLAEQLKAAGGPGRRGGGESDEAPTRDIRETLRKMQGSEKRKRADEEALMHQSTVESAPVAECGPAIVEFMNKNHADCLGAFAIKLNPELAATASKANAFMNGALVIPDAKIVVMDEKGMDLEARVVETGFFGNQKEKTMGVRVDYPNGEIHSHADSIKMALIGMLRSCEMISQTASVLAMPGIGSRGWSIPDDLFLNEVPCQPFIRDWFYRDACDALEVALRDDTFLKSVDGRMCMQVAPPEINDEMDVFRVGTMLELVRELSLRVALVMEKRVKVCIQGPLGEGFFTGVPLMLSGMMKVLRGMDWQSRAGEQYEGILVQELVDPRTGKVYYEGNKEGRVAFGDVSVNAVDDEDEVFIIIAPQSMTGAPIYDPLSEMVDKINGRPTLLINPRLKDKPSSGDVMTVRGRAARIAFAESFREIFHFQLLFKGGNFPILGALRMNLANSPFWTVFKKVDTKDDNGMEGEKYVPTAVFEDQPSAGQITELIR